MDSMKTKNRRDYLFTNPGDVQTDNESQSSFDRFARAAAKETASILNAAGNLKYLTDALRSGESISSFNKRTPSSDPNNDLIDFIMKKINEDHAVVTASNGLADSSDQKDGEPQKDSGPAGNMPSDRDLSDPSERSFSSDSEEIKLRITALVAGFNHLIETLNKSGGLFHSDIYHQLQHAIPEAVLSDLGIDHSSNGTFNVNEHQMDRHVGLPADQSSSHWSENGELLTFLGQAADYILSLSAEALLNKQSDSYRSMINYSFDPATGLQAYLPMPLIGLLLNIHF